MAIVRCQDCGNGVSDRAASCPKCACPLTTGKNQIRESNVQSTDGIAKSRKPILWLSLSLLAVVIAILLAPKFMVWLGVIIILLCIGSFLKTGADFFRLSAKVDATTTIGKIVSLSPLVQNFLRRILKLNSVNNRLSIVRLFAYGIAGLILIVAGWTSHSFNSEREREASNISIANAQVVALVGEAESAWQAKNLGLAEEKLSVASKMPKATDLAPVQSLRTRIANAKVERLIVDASTALNAGEIEVGKQTIQLAIATPHANALTEARKIQKQINDSTDSNAIRAALIEITDEAFQQMKVNAVLPLQLRSGYQGLDRHTTGLAKLEITQATEARGIRRVAQLEVERKRQEIEQKRLDQVRIDAEEAKRKAEVERNREAVAKAEAARKAEEEYESDGLVLMRKSVKSENGLLGITVTGTVVNRRSKTHSYAQITFNIYDASDAQIGSAVANINGLEPGSRWNFKAVSFIDGATYRFSKLSGY